MTMQPGPTATDFAEAIRAIRLYPDQLVERLQDAFDLLGIHDDAVAAAVQQALQEDQ